MAIAASIKHRATLALWFRGILLLAAIGAGSALSLAQDTYMQVRWDTAGINELLHRAQKLTLSGKTDSARRLYTLIGEQSRYLAYDYGLIKAEIGQGNIAINNGSYNEALNYYTGAIGKCKSRKTLMLLTTLHNNIGNIHTLKGNYEKSTEQYELALGCAERYGSELALETLYNNLSIALNRLNLPRRSLFYLEKAEKLALESSNYYTLADIYNNKGSAYAELENAERSLFFFNEAVLVSKKNGYQSTLYSALVNVGIHYLNTGRVKDAISKFEEADKLDASINSYYRNLKTLASGAAHLKNGSLDKAKSLLLESLKQAMALGNLKDQVTTHGLLAELYRSRGDFARAFEHRSKELLLFDSLKRKETSYMVAEMEARYSATLKDKELAKKQLTISRQSAVLAKKNRWIMGGIAGLCITGILIWIQSRSFRRKQKIKNEQLKLLEQQQENVKMRSILDGAEKERIRLSREIHDSIMVQFSVVKMNLSVYAGSNAPGLTPELLAPIVKQLDEATDNLRRTAHNLMPDRLIEDGLVEAVFYFCANLQKSVPVAICFQPIGAIPQLPTRFELSLYRIIQELVQNIIKHADASEAIVQLSCEHDLLSVTVEDNGKGMPEQNRSEGSGLKSIEARVHEFSGRFTVDTARNVGTTVHLEFSVEAIKEKAGSSNKLYI